MLIFFFVFLSHSLNEEGSRTLRVLVSEHITIYLCLALRPSHTHLVNVARRKQKGLLYTSTVCTKCADTANAVKVFGCCVKDNSLPLYIEVFL